jgi:hypothetical protein
MRQLRRFLKLSLGDRLFLMTTFALLGAIRLGLYFLPFRTLLRLLKLFPSQTPLSAARKSIKLIVWAVEVSSCYTPGQVKCLARALTTKTLLNWYGYSAELHLGIAKTTSGIEAHAWVEYQGHIIIGNLQDLGRFTPLPSLNEVSL